MHPPQEPGAFLGGFLAASLGHLGPVYIGLEAIDGRALREVAVENWAGVRPREEERRGE